jgi:F-type H+-transporting ATPase subunit b
MDQLLSINPGLAIWTVVSFLALLLLLRKLAWGPILAALERREKRIEDAIGGAERSRDEAGRILEEQKETLKKAKEEARAMIAEATADAARRGEEIVAESRREAERLLERARTEIRGEEAQAIDRVRREAVELALDAAERLVGRSMETADHRRIVEEFISESAKATRGKTS